MAVASSVGMQESDLGRGWLSIKSSMLILMHVRIHERRGGCAPCSAAPLTGVCVKCNLVGGFWYPLGDGLALV